MNDASDPAQGGAEADTIALRIVIPTAEIRGLTGEVTAAGGTVVDTSLFVPAPREQDDYLQSAFEPLSVLACVVGVTWAAERIIRMVKLTRHSGLIVEKSDTGFEVREHPALAPGSVLSLGPEGARYMETPAQLDTAGLLKLLGR